MFSRNEASRLSQEFWTTFGKYMRPVSSADGMKVNWVNYHTGLKDVYFRMDARGKSAVIAISIEHADHGIRSLYYEQFRELRGMLHTAVGEEWDWREEITLANGKAVSRIVREYAGISVVNKNDWPELISFFKPRIIALDAFWDNAKWSFEELKG